jgi:hypothetical protein
MVVTMPRRKLVVPFVIGAGSFLGTILYRRRSVRNRTRLDVYFDDGSMVSLAAGSPDADRLMPHAADVLDAARSGA